MTSELFQQTVTQQTTKEILYDKDDKKLTVIIDKTTYSGQRRMNPKTKKPGVWDSKKIIDKTTEKMEVYLQVVTPKEISRARNEGIPSFVLKMQGICYYSEIPKTLDLTLVKKIMQPHQCTIIKKECSRLSAAKDCDGGCEKVRNFSKGIEQYEFIEDGYEIFNTYFDKLYVGKCKNYVPTGRRTEIPVKELKETIECLHSYLTDGHFESRYQ